MITDEARRLFAVVVNELWDKHPELVVPGWMPTGDGRFSTDSGRSCGWEDVFPDMADDADILAAAALCAENAAGSNIGADGRVRAFAARMLADAIAQGPEAVFRLHLTEKGIEHE